MGSKHEARRILSQCGTCSEIGFTLLIDKQVELRALRIAAQVSYSYSIVQYYLKGILIDSDPLGSRAVS